MDDIGRTELSIRTDSAPSQPGSDLSLEDVLSQLTMVHTEVHKHTHIHKHATTHVHRHTPYYQCYYFYYYLFLY